MTRKVIVRKFEVYIVDLNKVFTSAEDMKYQFFGMQDNALAQAFLTKEVEIEWNEDSELNKIYPVQEEIEKLLK